jgi:hypothetical protein
MRRVDKKRKVKRGGEERRRRDKE